MGLSIFSAAKAIPWVKILTYTPAITEAVEKIVGSIKENQTNTSSIKSLDQLTERVLDLESNNEKQALLFQNISKHLEELTNASKVLSHRIFIAFLLSAIALVISIISFVIVI